MSEYYEKRGLRRVQTDRVRDFQRTRDGRRGYGEFNKTFTIDDVLDKFGYEPVCYLSGRRLDWSDPGGWSFDHVVPIFRGGDSSIDNLEMTAKDLNAMKGSMLLEEFLDACEEVLKYHGRLTSEE